jgi:hypothetical protein
VRLAPRIHNHDESTYASMGASLQCASLTFGDAPDKNNRVCRYGFEGDVRWGPVNLYGEYIHQRGLSTLTFPEPDKASASNQYLYGVARLVFTYAQIYYVAELADYLDNDIQEITHVGGLGFQFHKNLVLKFEVSKTLRYVAGPGLGEATTTNSSFITAFSANF